MALRFELSPAAKAELDQICKEIRGIEFIGISFSEGDLPTESYVAEAVPEIGITIKPTELSPYLAAREERWQFIYCLVSRACPDEAALLEGVRNWHRRLMAVKSKTETVTLEELADEYHIKI